MSRPLRYALLGTLVALALGLAAWCLLTGYRPRPTTSDHWPLLAVGVGLATLLVAGKVSRRCGRGCGGAFRSQEDQP